MEALLTLHETTEKKKRGQTQRLQYNLHCIPHRFVHSHCCNDDAPTVCCYSVPSGAKLCLENIIVARTTCRIWHYRLYDPSFTGLRHLGNLYITQDKKEDGQGMWHAFGKSAGRFEGNNLGNSINRWRNFIQIDPDRHHWRALANTVNFLNSRATTNFRRRTVSCSYLQNKLVTPMARSSTTLGRDKYLEFSFLIG